MSAALRAAMTGRWHEALPALAGVDERHLANRHGPCPACGGTDRYRFDDRNGEGTYYCNGCGAGDGFSLLMKCTGWDFARAAREVERFLGIGSSWTSCAPNRSQARPQRTQEPVRPSALARLINAAVPLSDPAAKPVLNYLENRLGKLPSPLPRLGCVPMLAYYEDGKIVAEYPAMLALLRDMDGRVKQAQKTYVCDGMKAPVPTPKKNLPGAFPRGCAVRMYRIERDLAHVVVGEGIESTLALREHLGGDLPAWSYLTAGNLAVADLPFEVSDLDIAVDRDDAGSRSYAGPRAAWELRQRQHFTYTRTTLHVPPLGCKDWCDARRCA